MKLSGPLVGYWSNGEPDEKPERPETPWEEAMRISREYRMKQSMNTEVEPIGPECFGGEDYPAQQPTTEGGE